MTKMDSTVPAEFAARVIRSARRRRFDELKRLCDEHELTGWAAGATIRRCLATLTELRFGWKADVATLVGYALEVQQRYPANAPLHPLLTLGLLAAALSGEDITDGLPAAFTAACEPILVAAISEDLGFEDAEISHLVAT